MKNGSGKHKFSPSLDGRLEARQVLSAAGTVAVAQVAGTDGQPVQTIDTRTYNNILVNVHKAVVQYGRSDGGPAAVDRAAMQIARQLDRVPFATEQGLTAEVADAIQFYQPNEFRQLYQDIHATTVDFLRGRAVDGDVLVMKSRQHASTDSDFFGPHAREGMTFPFPSVLWNPAATTTPPRIPTFSTRTYNSILVNVHKATTQFGQSAGTQADYDRAASLIGRQINLIPYANSRGLTAEVVDAIQFYQPSEAEILYGDVRATASAYIRDLATAREIHVMRPPGLINFSDTDILAPPDSRAFNQTVLR